MSFTGSVEKQSHEGGLLIAFEGRAPRLGATLRIVGGKPIGRVNSVIGAVDRALIHIHPIDGNIDPSMTIGSPVEIAPREKRDRERRNDRFDRRGRDGGRGGYQERRDNRGQDRGNRGGDWTCPKCKNSNFAFRNKCNRCEADKPEGNQGRDNRGRDGGERRNGNNRRPSREGGRRVFRGDDSSRNSRGRSPGSSNRPRRGGFRGPNGGSNRGNRPGRSSGRR